MSEIVTYIGRLRIVCFLILCCCFATELQAASYGVTEIPNVQLTDRTRYTSNPDGILSTYATERIDRICDSLRREGLAQVAVVAVEDIDGYDTFEFAIELFRRWGVGRAKVDNGLGILLVQNRREIRFVTGGGIEGVLPDALCKRIQLEYMLPYFREGDYDGGMTAGVEAVAQLLRSGELDFGSEEDDEPLVVMLIIMALVMLGFAVVAYLAYRQQTRCPRCGKLTLKQADVKLSRLFIEKTFVCSNCGYRLVRRQVRIDDNSIGGGPFIGGGSIFGGGGSFGGGGGGSFGGGSFGGGGAGSRW